MSDYIERDKAIDAIREHIKDIDGDNDALDYIATNMLKDVPSARPKGEWIDTKGGWKCTVCDKWASFASDFCPNCGARMKGADDE